MGEKACDIHPDDRDSQYACNSWHYTPPDVTSDISAVREIVTDVENQTRMHYMNYPVQKISFRIREPVILTKLGLHQVGVMGVKCHILFCLTYGRVQNVKFESLEITGSPC